MGESVEYGDLDGLWPGFASTGEAENNVYTGNSLKNFYEEHKEGIDLAAKVAVTILAVAGIAAITVATGGLGSSLFAAAKTGMINNKTANFLRVAGNGAIAGIGTGVSVKISDPDISSEELFERMGAAFLAGVTTLAGELLKKTSIAKYLYKINGQAYIDLPERLIIYMETI